MPFLFFVIILQISFLLQTNVYSFPHGAQSLPRAAETVTSKVEIIDGENDNDGFDINDEIQDEESSDATDFNERFHNIEVLKTNENIILKHDNTHDEIRNGRKHLKDLKERRAIYEKIKHEKGGFRATFVEHQQSGDDALLGPQPWPNPETLKDLDARLHKQFVENGNEFKRLRRSVHEESTENIKTIELQIAHHENMEESSGEVEKESKEINVETDFDKTINSTEIAKNNKEPPETLMIDKKSKEFDKNSEIAKDNKEPSIKATEAGSNGKEPSLTDTGRETEDQKLPETFKRNKKDKGFWEKAVDTVVITNFIVDAIGRKTFPETFKDSESSDSSEEDGEDEEDREDTEEEIDSSEGSDDPNDAEEPDKSDEPDVITDEGGKDLNAETVEHASSSRKLLAVEDEEQRVYVLKDKEDVAHQRRRLLGILSPGANHGNPLQETGMKVNNRDSHIQMDHLLQNNDYKNWERVHFTRVADEKRGQDNDREGPEGNDRNNKEMENHENSAIMKMSVDEHHADDLFRNTEGRPVY